MNRSTLIILVAGLSNLAAAEDCSQIANDNERLACFDNAHRDSESTSLKSEALDVPVEATVATGVAVDPADQAQTSGHSKTEEASRKSDSAEDFGKKQGFDMPTEYIEATIVEVLTNSLDIDYLRLDNGQVWREYEDSRFRFKVGRRVKIEEGAFGSFDLTVEGSSRVMKVKRMR